jgi:Holliday junction resolvase RusA-like endonuclease
MRELLTFSVEVKAVARPALVSNKGTAAVRYDARTADRYRQMKAVIRQAAHAHLPVDWRAVDGPIEVRIVVERESLKSDPLRVFKLTTPDIHDNVAKGLVDAHTGLVFVDDKQVVAMSIAETYGDSDRVTFQFNLLDDEDKAWIWQQAGPREQS